MSLKRRAWFLDQSDASLKKRGKLQSSHDKQKFTSSSGETHEFIMRVTYIKWFVLSSAPLDKALPDKLPSKDMTKATLTVSIMTSIVYKISTFNVILYSVQFSPNCPEVMQKLRQKKNTEESTTRKLERCLISVVLFLHWRSLLNR